MRSTIQLRTLSLVGIGLLAWAAASCGGDGSGNGGAAAAGGGQADAAAGSGGTAGGGGGGSAGSGGLDAGTGGVGGSAGAGATGGGGTAGTGGTTNTGGAGGTGGGSSCVDTCPAPNGGIPWSCQKRFMYGVNYAWRNFSGDFGGISAWSNPGVSSAPNDYAADLADMRSHGANVIRWWIFPDFRGDGIEFDSSDTPTGLGGTALADVEKALELAEQNDVYLMLCLFSFDGFRPSESVAGIWTPGIKPMVETPATRTALLQNVVRPFAAAVASSPYAHRMIAWDVINEPEWAMTGPSPYGDQSYDPSADLDPVSPAIMESFVSDVIGVLRSESQALVTVGGAAFKWAHAWSQVDIDFYQFHMYDWINTWWPYSDPASTYNLSKPIVMGEFPMGDLTTGVSYDDVVSSWWNNGFAGALSWQYDEATPAGLASVQTFATQHDCETHYTIGANGSSHSATTQAAHASPKAGAAMYSPRRCAVVDGRPVCRAIP